MLYFQHCACCRRGGLCHRSFRHSSQWRLFHPQPWLSEMLQAVSASSELERSTFIDLWLLVSLDQKDGYDLFWIVYILLCYVFYYLYYCINYLVPEDILEHLGFIASNDCYCIFVCCAFDLCVIHILYGHFIIDHRWPVFPKTVPTPLSLAAVVSMATAWPWQRLLTLGSRYFTAWTST